jgi:competence protein ComGC
MIQEILVLIIIGVVILKVIHSVYKSLTAKDKAGCEGCAGCGVKNDLKKRN